MKKIKYKNNVTIKKNLNLRIYLLIIPITMVYLNSNLERPLVGEEGMFALIIRERVFAQSNLLIGNLENGLLWIHPEHPILIYWTLILTGSASQILKFLGIEEVYSIRLVNLIPLFILLYFLKFKFANRDYVNSLLQIMLFFLILANPIFNYEILKIQTDTLSGNFLFLLFGVLMLQNSKNISRKHLLGFTSFFFISVGKQEWTISALLSILVIFIVFFRFKSKNTKKSLLLKFTNSAFLGLIAGNVLNFIIDSKNYLGGFDVIKRTVFNSSTTQQFDGSRFLLYFEVKFIYLFVPLLLLIYTLILIFLLRDKLNFLDSISLNLIGLTCFFSYLQLLITYYSLDLRYATPASILSILLFAYVHKIIFEKKLLSQKSVLIPVLIMFIGLLLPKTNFSKYYYEEKRIDTSNKCVNYINSSQAFDDYSNILWISSDLGQEGAQRYFNDLKIKLPIC